VLLNGFWIVGFFHAWKFVCAKRGIIPEGGGLFHHRDAKGKEFL